MEDFKMWVYVRKWNKAICAPPKCGSRSLLYTLVKHFYGDIPYVKAKPSLYKNKTEHFVYMPSNEINQSWNKIAILRDPVERFSSLWEHHCRDGTPGIPHVLRLGATPDELISYIEMNGSANPNWATQNTVIGEHQNIQYLLLGGLSKFWKGWAGMDFEYENKTEFGRALLSASVINRVKQFYAEDYCLMEKL